MTRSRAACEKARIDLPRGVAAGPAGVFRLRRSSEVYLTADLGAGSLRVAAITPTGRVLASEQRPLAIDAPQPGHAEADPELWWRALREALGRLLDRVDGAVPLALGLTGMTRSQVFLDRDGRACRPAILWRDTRAAADAETVTRHVASPNPATAVNAFHPLARLAWLARAEPETFAAVDRVLEPKDDLVRRLTGVSGADSVTAARLDDLAAPSPDAPDWLLRALALLDVARAAPWSQIGTVTATEAPFARLRDLPVIAGAMDTWAGAVGSGVAAAGRAYDVAGTSEAVGLVTASAARVPGLVTLPWSETAHQLGGPTQAGGDAAAWAHRTFRVASSLAVAVARAGRLRPTANLPLFLPYLAGERAPVWRSDVRGALSGLDRAHDGDALLYAALEGVAHAVRDILDHAARGAGATIDEVRVSGGGARSDPWCALKANVLGRPIVRPREVEAGLLGCAVAASVALGRHPTLAEAAEALVRIDRVFEPDPALSDLFAERAARYDALKAETLRGSGR